MTLSDLASIGSFVSGVAVLISLIFLLRQIRQANLLAKSEARQRMVEQTQEELYEWMHNPDLPEAYLPVTTLSGEAQAKLHFFLVAAMRQREWEWFQYKDGVIGRDVYQAYHGVIGLHLGIARTRQWWATVGRVGFNPAFVAEVDAFLASRPLAQQYFEDIRRFDTQPPERATPDPT